MELRTEETPNNIEEEIENTVILPMDNDDDNKQEDIKIEKEDKDIKEDNLQTENSADIQFFFDEPDEEEKNKEDIKENKEENKKVEQESEKEESKEPIEGIEFFFDDNLDQYIKEAQKNDIGYLNGDEPEEEKPKKTTTKKTSTKTTSNKTETKKKATKTTSTAKKTTTKTTSKKTTNTPKKTNTTTKKSGTTTRKKKTE